MFGSICLKKMGFLILITGSVVFAMDDSAQREEQEYRKQVSLLDAYLGQYNIGLQARIVIINDYQIPGVEYRMRYKEFLHSLYCANQKIVETFNSDAFPEAEIALTTCGNNPSKLTERDKYYLMVMDCKLFNSGEDLVGDEEIELFEYKVECDAIRAQRQLYHTAWPTKDVAKINAALKLKLYPDSAPYIPFAQKLEELKRK